MIYYIIDKITKTYNYFFSYSNKYDEFKKPAGYKNINSSAFR